VSKLWESRGRREQGLFPIEGWHEIQTAVAYGHRPQAIYCEEGHLDRLQQWLNESNLECACFLVSKSAFVAMSSRESPDGILGVFALPELPVLDLADTDDEPLILLQGLEKPGNLGAIVRSAAAFGFTKLVLLGGTADPFHPHVVRNSRGHSLGMDFFRDEDDSASQWLEKHHYQIFVADPEGTHSLGDIRFPKRTAILLGSEHDGISDYWKNHAATQLRIPMTGKVDSLNVAVSASILLYAVFTQTHA
jgi:RNA methyltransferase, TrmH family